MEIIEQFRSKERRQSHDKGYIFCSFFFQTEIELYFFFQTEIDIITNKDEWNSWPGYVLVGVRMIIMIWFIVLLRQTFRQSQHPDRLDFFQQFGAYFLVWFIYLPVLVLIATQISFLWRFKTILSKYFCIHHRFR